MGRAGSSSTTWGSARAPSGWSRRRASQCTACPRARSSRPRAARVHRLAREGRRRARQRLAAELAALSRALLQPAAETLGRHRRWLLVLDGGLARVPFAALPLPGEDATPLVARHELVRLPSASLAVALRARGAARRPAPRLLAVVADPQLEPRLEHAAAEASAVAAAAAHAWRVEGTAFDQALFDSGALERFRIVHLVTHARAEERRPELSYLALAARDRAGRPLADTRLYAFETYRLRLPAELVVLSACSTGLGRTVRGEGLLGLTHGFFHAGAQRVLASLWDVDDRSTSVLMGELYRRLLVAGETPGEALRGAQERLRQDPRWRSPRHWAGFVLEGDWRPLAGARRGD
jgi:CHAT domain-containing protein